jgi:hypothetical protein
MKKFRYIASHPFYFMAVILAILASAIEGDQHEQS